MSTFARVNLESDSPLDIIFNVDEGTGNGGQELGVEEKERYFLPQDSNIKSVRELVIDTQTKRKAKVGNRFVERMEDNLVKWKPPLSSNRGTTMAIEGIHPYQREINENEVVTSERIATSAKLFDSFTHWWKENARGILDARRQQLEEEFFSFSDFQEQDRVIEVTVAPTIPEEDIREYGDSCDLNNDDALFRQFISMDRNQPLNEDIMFSSASSISCSSQHTYLAGPAIQTPRVALRNKVKSQEIYAQSYNRPIPPTYLPQQQPHIQQSPVTSPPPLHETCTWTNWLSVIKECIST
ncbi:Uncharacterized protein RNJ44_01514 [Nakaseomyces bracarensis]|uniref:Uncharacterized protein n=1 Tax=Nakaseomyces bracarensis TaxID=273131 RepID=A0ABR4NPW4_9SACH